MAGNVNYMTENSAVCVGKGSSAGNFLGRFSTLDPLDKLFGSQQPSNNFNTLQEQVSDWQADVVQVLGSITAGGGKPGGQAEPS